MGGALLALMPVKERSNITAHVSSLAGFALVILGIAIVREENSFPAPMAILPVVGSVLLIFAGKTGVVNRTVLSNPLMVGIGLISYPLYLWHWPLLSFPAIVTGGDVPAYIRASAVILAVILSILTYYVLETPFRKFFTLRPGASIASGLLAIGLVAGLYTGSQAGFPARPVVQAMMQVEKDFSGPMWEFTKNDFCMNRYSPTDVEKYGWWFCMLSANSDPTVLLLGDSFANHYYAGVVQNPKFENDVILSIGTCEPSTIYESEVVADDPQIFSPCTSKRRYDQQVLINKIIEKGTIKLVIMGGIIPDPTGDYIRRLKERVAFVESHGAQVVMILPHLRSTYFTKACFARPFQPTPQSCVEPAEKAISLRAGVQPLVDSVSAEFPGVRFFNPNTVYCTDEECSFILDGRPLFRDEYDHLSNLASTRVIKRMVETIY